MSSHASPFIDELLPRLERFWRVLSQNQQQIARISLGVSLLLIVLIAFSSARLTWILFFTPSIDITPLSPQASIQQHTAESKSLSSVSDLHLFGFAEIPTETIVEAPITAPETRLQLILRGVYASRDRETAIAIIAEQGKEDQPYRVGDRITSGTTLHQVYSDRVIIKRSGTLETLKLEQIMSEETASRAVSYQPEATPAETRSSPRIQRLREMFARDPEKLWKQIRITPSSDGRGFHFVHNDRMLMRDLGLEADDVITAINGTPVSDMGSMMEMMNSIQSMTELNLDVIRNGNTESININLN